MKKTALLTSLLVGFQLYAAAQNNTVRIKCTQTSDYCGGARPSEEMLEELQQPKPIVSDTFYIVKGKTNTFKIFKKVVTDKNGFIRLKLPKGTYSIYTKAQMQPFKAKQNTDIQTWDNECLRKMHKTPLAIFNAANKKVVSFNLHQKCFYNLDCGTYSGPLPP